MIEGAIQGEALRLYTYEHMFAYMHQFTESHLSAVYALPAMIDSFCGCQTTFKWQTDSDCKPS